MVPSVGNNVNTEYHDKQCDVFICSASIMEGRKNVAFGKNQSSSCSASPQHEWQTSQYGVECGKECHC